MPEKLLQPVAFTLRPDLDVSTLPLFGLTFPDTWWGLLKVLQGELRDRSSLPNTVPIRSLNAVLQALVPYLLSVPRQVADPKEAWNGTEAKSDPWVIAQQPVSPECLWLVVQAWLERTYGDCPSFVLGQQSLRQEDLHWEPITLALLEPPAANGTARPPRLAYSAVPALLAERLMSRSAEIPIMGEKRQLVRIPTEEGTELMTWPPVYYKDEQNKEWGYSYILAITLQTLPGNPEARIHVHYRVRRWRNGPIYDGEKLLLGRYQASVYLHRTTPWLGIPPTTAFTLAKLKPAYEEHRRIPIWASLVPDIAQRLRVAFPDAVALAQDPIRWLQGHDGVEAGITWQTPRYHPIGQGVGQDDHERLTTLLAEGLQSEIRLSPPLERLKIQHKEEPHPLIGDLRKISAEERLAGLVHSIGPNVTMEVFWETEAIRDMLVDRIKAMLTESLPDLITSSSPELGDTESHQPRLSPEEESREQRTAKPRAKPRVRAAEPEPPPAPGETSLPLPGGGWLRIVPRRLGDLGSPLPQPDKSRPDLKQRTEERARQIQAVYLPRPSEPTLALIELPNYQDPQKPAIRRQFGRNRDPKRAIRLGMAQAGRVTQFITNDPQKLRKRCEAAVRDGLRHLGYLPAPIGFRFQTGPTLLENLIVAGVWRVSLTRRRGIVPVHFPVVVFLHTQRHQIFAWIPDSKGIRSYYQALLDITTIDPEKVKRHNRTIALRELQNFLQGELPNQGIADMVILTMAQNIRDTWPGMNNTNLGFDQLRFTSDGPTHSAGRVRLIRLRTYERGETPEWYIPGANPDSVYQGVWKEPTTARLFYNNSGKPHTMARKRKSKQIDPTASYALPSLLEVLPVAYQESDSLEIWPYAIDQWRRMSVLTNMMTLLPLPLELAKKMGEYAEVIGPWVFSEQWEEEDEEEKSDEDAEEEDGDEDDEEGEESSEDLLLVRQLELFS